MNSIITLPKLTELLAEAASVDLKTAQSFITDLTSMIGEALKTDGTVNIKGLGVFNRVVSDNKIKVEFIADKEISDSINAPFLFFEPVQLADGIPSESIEEISTETNFTSDVDPSQIEKQALEPVEQSVEVAQKTEDSPSAVSEESGKAEQSELVVVTEAPEEDTADKEEVSDIPNNSEKHVIAEDSTESIEETVSEKIQNDEIAPESLVEKTEIEADSTPYSSEKDNLKVSVDATEDPVSAQKEEPEYSEIAPKGDAKYDSIDDEEETMKLPWFTISLFFVVGLMVGLGLGYFGHDYIRGRATSNSIIPSEPELEVVPLDTAAQDDTTFVDLSDATEDMVDNLPTESNGNQDRKDKEEATITETSKKTEDTPAAATPTDKTPEPVYDVITPGSDLISLSVKHYKNKEYWVYIYEANKSKIKNPNNVMSGLRLVIPPKSQCDISTDETKNIEAAKAKSAQILRQFKK